MKSGVSAVPEWTGSSPRYVWGRKTQAASKECTMTLDKGVREGEAGLVLGQAYRP